MSNNETVEVVIEPNAIAAYMKETPAGKTYSCGYSRRPETPMTVSQHKAAERIPVEILPSIISAKEMTAEANNLSSVSEVVEVCPLASDYDGTVIIAKMESPDNGYADPYQRISGGVVTSSTPYRNDVPRCESPIGDKKMEKVIAAASERLVEVSPGNFQLKTIDGIFPGVTDSSFSKVMDAVAVMGDVLSSAVAIADKDRLNNDIGSASIASYTSGSSEQYGSFGAAGINPSTRTLVTMQRTDFMQADCADACRTYASNSVIIEE